MRRIGKGIAALALTATAFAGTATAVQAAPSQSHGGGGLVNVYLVKLLNGNQVTVLKNVAIPVAAAVCGVDVNVLTKQLGNGAAVCKALTNADQVSWIVPA